jgi:hypothetical protein
VKQSIPSSCQLTVQVHRIKLKEMIVVVEEIMSDLARKNSRLIFLSFSAVSSSAFFETEKAM